MISGKLPQVSWILSSGGNSEHPSGGPPAPGIRFVAGVLHALTADPDVWEKTVILYTFDENDGFFDHVPPPTAPTSSGEYIDQVTALSHFEATIGTAGPVGLGFRVPMTVISPFSRAAGSAQRPSTTPRC